jgi:dTDP-4-dehydrorhamnose reductase
MRILLFGKDGQLGWELQRSLQPLGEVTALNRTRTSGLCGDLTDLDGIADTVRTLKPHVIINAGAYTAVDQAESDKDTAFMVNAKAPAVLAREAKALGAWLIHYSTDYVFPGTGDTPWSESDTPRPLSVYALSKLQGEEEIAAATDKYITLRTSWVYAARGKNFAKTMLRLARERNTLKVVSDQIGAPTGAELIADVSAHIIRKIFCLDSAESNSINKAAELAGIYHLAPSGFTSWHGYAQLVISHAQSMGYALKISSDQIEAIPTSAYPTPAPRPLNSRLQTEKLRQAFDLHLPCWEQGVVRMVEEVMSAEY